MIFLESLRLNVLKTKFRYMVLLFEMLLCSVLLLCKYYIYFIKHTILCLIIFKFIYLLKRCCWMFCFQGNSFIVRQYVHFKWIEHTISLTLHHSRFFINSLLSHNFNQHHFTAYRSLSANTNATLKKKKKATFPHSCCLSVAHFIWPLTPGGYDLQGWMSQSLLSSCLLFSPPHKYSKRHKQGSAYTYTAIDLASCLFIERLASAKRVHERWAWECVECALKTAEDCVHATRQCL